MGTGLFQNRSSNQGLNFGTRKRAPGSTKHPERFLRRKIDVFADHLANGLDPRQAAQAMGLKATSANGMLQRVRREMGDQAR